MKVSNRFSLKKQINESIEYVRNSFGYIYFIIIIFFLSFLAGFIFPSNFSFLDKFLKDLIDKTVDLNWIELFLFIFQNNLQSAFFGLFLGIAFGIFPLINTLTNGVVLGYVSSKVASEVSIIELWRLLPHGIFELPAIFIALGLGLRLGLSVFQRKEGIKYTLYKSANSFLFVVLPLLLIAAFIESLLIIIG